MKYRKGLVFEYYSYCIPSILCVCYVIYLVVGYRSKTEICWLWKSEGFEELCKSIANFASIVLGIYGIFIPIIIGKMDENFSKRFWDTIDRDKFSRDIHRVILSGILTILLSSILLISDIMKGIVIASIIGVLIWVMLFFTCCSYRFIGIFIKLIVGKSNDVAPQINSPATQHEKDILSSGIEEF